MSKDEISCNFYNPDANEISSEGCVLIEVNENAIKCGCNHMTDFMAFFNTGLAVLEGSNYDVFLAVTQLSLENLKSNVGSYIAVTYWASFLIFFFILRDIDSRKMKSLFYEKLFLQMTVD